MRGLGLLQKSYLKILFLTMLNMKEVLLSLLTGGIVGIVFALVKLPIPAPGVLSGVVGIIGIYLGFKLVDLFM